MVSETHDYEIVSSEGLPPPAAQRTYWQIVKESLQEIYQKDPSLSDLFREVLKEPSKKSTKPSRLLSLRTWLTKETGRRQQKKYISICKSRQDTYRGKSCLIWVSSRRHLRARTRRRPPLGGSESRHQRHGGNLP
jgi:hypothetical protein